MKKNGHCKSSMTLSVTIKSILMIKLFIIFFFALTLQSFGRGYGQGKIKLSLKNVELKQALKALEAQGTYRFVYKDEILPKGSNVTIHVENASLQQVLDKMLQNTLLSYKQINEQLVVITKEIGASAQLAKTVSGRVVNEQGTPLAGVTVQEKGTSNGTSTGTDGTFSINVAGEDALLEISFVGFTTQTIKINNQTNLAISLVSATRQMDEVVVVGYGTQKKSVVTGAISSVKAGDIDNQPIARVEQFLQGRASGLTIASSSGQPGSSSTVRVRGTTSINGGASDPLYVVDGIPVDIGGIDYLNPNDIESIEVLKDAASAAIYGARSAAGVILVTTKKGRAGRTVLAYNGYVGTQAPARKLKLLNATEYATLRNEAAFAGSSTGAIPFSNPAALGKGTDWQSLVFNNSAKIQDHQISISGGSDRSTFFTSFGLFDQ
ncbi:MAG TPA: TonB-dependent receptor plug domain-containing protein, partial [Segetibacter sp.]